MARVRDSVSWLAHRMAPDVSVATADDLPLAAFQEAAASRLAEMVRQWGGALLADAVGLGKTRVALTVASTIARERRTLGDRGSIWLCVPARLRTAWRRAAGAAGLGEHAFDVVSHSMLSRGTVPATRPLMIVVDEAHRLRNRETKRRQTLAEHADAPLVLVTATPVANSVRDLLHLLELFCDDADVRATFGWDLQTAFDLAERGEWDVTELVRAVTVRRTSPPTDAGFGRRPSARLEVLPYDPPAAEAWLWRNLEPRLRDLSLAASGDDWPRGLFTEHVLRRWESGPEALLETLRALVAFHERWLEAHRLGRTLDRSLFRTLFAGDHRQQVFGFVYDDGVSADSPRPEAVATDLDVLRDLVEHAEAAVGAGCGRDEVIVDLARDGEPLLVFTSYRRAAREIFDRLVDSLGPTARIGLVTGDRALATGIGPATSDDVLRRFAPTANAADRLREHERLQVLVATDCIAEGTNLQDCGRVVLADLPYTPLGIEQRAGRLLRPGGPHAAVTVYLPRPRNWNDSLGMRRRLGRKFDAAASAGMASPNSLLGARPAERDPLAALTALDSLAARLDSPADVARFAATERPTRWLALADLGRGQSWMFRVLSDGSVDNDAAAFVADLTDLAFDQRELHAVEVPAEVEAVVERRRKFLRAANAAPSPLSIDAPEVTAWNLICARAEELDLEPDRLTDLRRRLLHRHRLGVRRRLALLADAGSAIQLLRYVEKLPAPETQELRVVAVLGIAER